MGTYSLQDILPKAPDRTIVPTDPQANALLNAGIDRAQRPEQAFADQANAGIKENAQAMNLGQDQINQKAAASGQDPAMMSAISNVYKGQAQSGIDRLMQKNSMGAGLNRAESLRKMAQAALGRQQVETQNYEKLTEAYNQQENGRAQFISSIFQAGRQGYMTSKMGSKAKTNDFGNGTPNVGGYDHGQESYGDGFDPSSMA